VYGLFLDGKHYTFAEVNHQPAICFWTNNLLYTGSYSRTLGDYLVARWCNRNPARG
jgi:hypothetical protein